VASLPRVQTVVVRRDWDRLIELGEAELASRAHANAAFVQLPLAAAFHQRACIAYAARDLTAALRDVRRAISLDPWIRYFVTRGVVRDAMGDRVGARTDYDRALTGPRIHRSPDAGLGRLEAWLDGSKHAFDGARALYARGVARLKAGKVDEACGDLVDALAVTLALRERGGGPLFSPPEEALVALEGVIRRAQSAASRAKTR
jgi:tetratricopeptide (TPR) repeat protein